MRENYSFNDLEPTRVNTVEKKIKNSANFAKILLWVNLKIKENSSAFKCNDIACFFEMDEVYVFKVLRFFVRHGLVKKIQRSYKDVIYVPIEKEIKKHIKIAKERYEVKK